MTGAEISVGGGYTATSQRQDSTFALIPKRCSASSFHHRRRGKSSRIQRNPPSALGAAAHISVYAPSMKKALDLDPA